jgi:hypothetical protein
MTMALPSAIAEALADVELSALPGRPADNGHECAGAKFHSPSPLLLHRVDLGGRYVLLCGTCRSNLAVLSALLDHHRELAWPVRRSFGNRLRELLIPKESDG